MKILAVKRPNERADQPQLTDPDCIWIAEQSYETLLVHFRQASASNRLYVGETAKFFARALEAKKAELSPETAKQIEDRVNAMDDPIDVSLKGTVH